MTKEQWQAIKNKDPEYDGKFYYVLRSTGVICRPVCDKKVRDPMNVIIFDTLEEALSAGYHPCKRCRPDHPGWKGAKRELADAVLEIIKRDYTKQFSLEDIAKEVHINKFHLLRTFKAVTGETPLQYHNKYRCEKAKELLEQPDLSISFIALETGFNSASHFSRVFGNIVGQTPSEFRKSYLKSLDE